MGAFIITVLGGGLCLVCVALGVCLTMDSMHTDAPDLYNEWMRRRRWKKRSL